MSRSIVGHMTAVDLIPLVWALVAAFVVAVCQVSSRADAREGQAEAESRELGR
jgi:hypothetical protein